MPLIYELLSDAMAKRFGGSVTRLAEACDVSVALTSRWVHEDPRKRIVPGPTSCEKIAVGLNLDPDYVLQAAGHRQPRPDQSETIVNPERQAFIGELNNLLNAVGQEYEGVFLEGLRDYAHSSGKMIRQIRTAVNPGEHAAVNAAVSARAQRGRTHRKDAEGPLTDHSRRIHASAGPLVGVAGRTKQRLVA